MPEGKFFVVQSCMNDMVLDIQDHAMESGTPIITWEETGGDNQIWFMDHAHSVIRSKANDNFVLEIQGDSLVLSEYNPDESNQKWTFTGDRIACRDNPDVVIDITDACGDAGASLCTWEYNGGDNQHWRCNHLEAAQCFIWSEDKDDKVMDIKGDDEDECARIVLYEKKDEENDNQIFYEDRNGLIRAFSTEFCFDTYDDGKLRVREYDGDISTQRWVKSGKKIVHRDDPSRCLQVKSGGFLKLAKVEEGEYSGDVSQKWNFEYI